MGYPDRIAPMGSGIFVGLIFAPAIAGFYGQYGFTLLADGGPFMGLWRNEPD